VRIEHKKALTILEKNGCKVDYGNNTVHFPPALVEESLRKCPSTFRLKARQQENDLILGGATSYFGAAPGMKAVDLDTWELRVTTRKDFYDGVTIIDALETVDYITQYTPYWAFEGISSVMAMPESFAGKARNSSKVQSEGYSNDCEIFTIQMAQAIGAEFFMPCLPAPPLTYFSDAIEAGLRGVEAGFPVKVGDGDVYGGTAPATIAGATISNNAELIAPIVLFQLVKPGTRIIASNANWPQNMRNGSPVFGGIESCLQMVVFNQIWRRYGVPTWDLSGCFTNGKRIDFQAGYERVTHAIISALSGGHGITIHGAIYGELAHHPLQAILDDDVVGMIGHFLEGVAVNDETLAVDLISGVGPIPGHFLGTAHTRKWWPREQFIPKSADRLTYPEWMKEGKKSCLDYAQERMEEILATHKPEPLTPAQDKDIERILEDATEYYRKKGML